MKKALIVCFLLMIYITAGVSASPAPGFDRVVDFSITLKQLNSMVSENNTEALKDKYFILNGALSSFSVVDKDPENYRVELMLVNGEWEGVSDVYIYRSVIIFQGKAYEDMFPARRKKTPGPSEVSMNSGLIIVAKLNNVINIGGVPVPVLDGYYLRIYK